MSFVCCPSCMANRFAQMRDLRTPPSRGVQNPCGEISLPSMGIVLRPPGPSWGLQGDGWWVRRVEVKLATGEAFTAHFSVLVEPSPEALFNAIEMPRDFSIVADGNYTRVFYQKTLVVQSTASDFLSAFAEAQTYVDCFREAS